MGFFFLVLFSMTRITLFGASDNAWKSCTWFIIRRCTFNGEKCKSRSLRLLFVYWAFNVQIDGGLKFKNYINRISLRTVFRFRRFFCTADVNLNFSVPSYLPESSSVQRRRWRRVRRTLSFFLFFFSRFFPLAKSDVRNNI